MPTPLVPIAISSQLDVTGEERIHAAKYTLTNRPAWVASPNQFYAASGNQTYLAKSVDGGTTFPTTVSTGLGTISSTTTVSAAGSKLFQWNGSAGAVSSDGSTFTPMVYGSSMGNVSEVIYAGGKWLAGCQMEVHVSADGVNFSALDFNGLIQPAMLGNTIVGGTGGTAVNHSVNAGVAFSTYTVTGMAKTDAVLATDTGFVMFGRAPTTSNLVVAKSATGLTGSWTVAAGPSTSFILAVARNATTGRIVLFNAAGNTYYSDDSASTWTAGAANLYTAGDIIPPFTRRMTCDGTKFLLCVRQESGNNRIYSSPNGVTDWSFVYLGPVSQNLNAVVKFP